MTQIILDKTKEQVKGETDNIQKEVRKLKENVIPSSSVIPKPITDNQNINENHNNARPSTQPKIELPMSDTNPNEPFSMLPQDQNYYQTSPHTMHSLTQNAGPIIPSGVADQTLVRHGYFQTFSCDEKDKVHQIVFIRSFDGVSEDNIKNFFGYVDEIDVVYRDEIRNFNQLYPIHPSNSRTHNRNDRGYWNPPPTPQQNIQRNNSHYTGTNPFNIRRNNSQHWQGNSNYYYNGYPNSNYNQNNNSYIQNNNSRRNRNYRDQRREDNRYHPEYFQRNNIQQHPNMYYRNNSNDNTSYSHGRNNVWGNHNGQPSRHMQYGNPQFVPNGTPNVTRGNVNNQTADTWVTHDRNVNIIELGNEPNPQQQPNLPENERRPS
ncbi:probable serine/threonine-protein kinase clkA [Schistocerca piceifrons]|uniref:probable serine/threonine-protein kinase clkA n=1 Tax=Schistocerca piceifrons TaxID=274613 RepID=UPI001F5F477D|nr:probable serine/threonine-protein kinase clkA [Schistocerca piceifrons]